MHVDSRGDVFSDPGSTPGASTNAMISHRRPSPPRTRTRAAVPTCPAPCAPSSTGAPTTETPAPDESAPAAGAAAPPTSPSSTPAPAGGGLPSPGSSRATAPASPSPKRAQGARSRRGDAGRAARASPTPPAPPARRRRRHRGRRTPRGSPGPAPPAGAPPASPRGFQEPRPSSSASAAPRPRGPRRWPPDFVTDPGIDLSEYLGGQPIFVPGSDCRSHTATRWGSGRLPCTVRLAPALSGAPKRAAHERHPRSSPSAASSPTWPARPGTGRRGSSAQTIPTPHRMISAA